MQMNGYPGTTKVSAVVHTSGAVHIWPKALSGSMSHTHWTPLHVGMQCCVEILLEGHEGCGRHVLPHVVMIPRDANVPWGAFGRRRASPGWR
jgi:hypothetical protein